MPSVLRPRHLALLVVALVMTAAAATDSRAPQLLERLRIACGGRASSAHADGGLPVALTSRQIAGPYAVSVWANPDVGIGRLYVVVVPHDDVPFVAPRDVRITVRPASGPGAEQRYVARPEPVRHGARFVTDMALPRAERWNVRVVLDGASGRGELQSTLEATEPGSPGLAGMLFYAAPFVLVAGLWGRARSVRRQPSAGRPATLPSPRPS